MTTDFSNLDIEQCKLFANSEAYFKLFEKHLTGSYNKCLLYTIGNIETIANIMRKNEKATYYIYDNGLVVDCLKAGMPDWKKFHVMLADSRKTTNEQLWNGVKKMKFDKIIMNPPYSSGKGHDSKPLHLKILKEAQSHVNFENGGKVICLHPSKWIKRFDYWNNKWKCFNVEECDFISGIESTKLFGAAIGSELSITVIGKNGTTEYKSFSRFIQWVNDKIIDKAPIKMSDKNSKYRTYNPNEKFILNLPIIHGHTNCFDYTEITSKDFNKALKVAFGKREQDINSLKFDSDVERKNFYDSTFTYFYKFLILICRDGQTSSSCYYALPLMDSYKNEWTDERLCKFFNITDDEFAYMKKVVDDYKQQCEELRK